MAWLARAPPVVSLALAVCAGATLVHLGCPRSWGLFPLLPLLFPIKPSVRPLFAAVTAGALLTGGWQDRTTRDCRLHLQDNWPMELTGHLRGRVEGGRGELEPIRSRGADCRETHRLVFPYDLPHDSIASGPVTVFGHWRKSGVDPHPLWSGYLKVDSMVQSSEANLSLQGWVHGLRGSVQRRLRELFPTRHGLAEALILARKEGLGAGTREAFARAGVAHLLAISGFHVGVVAGLLLLLTTAAGSPLRSRYIVAGAAVWSYVVLIGLPDAAVRASLILTVVAVGRLLARPVSPLGALATAFLFFFVADPGALLRPGFQLSFAGAAGLVLWAPGITTWVMDRFPGIPRNSLTGALAAGIAATLATLPLVAWHFGRVSLVGIPVTLLTAPMVALAIPGILACLLLSTLAVPVAGPLAGGVDLILQILSAVVETVARVSYSSVFVSRPGVLAGILGFGGAWAALTAFPGKPLVSRVLLAAGAGSGIILWPVVDLVLDRGAVELVVIDVGQGDALALRSPRGRWILIDAGPASTTFDAGERRVLPYLRRRGVERIELLVLTHPDMDHIGGARSLINGLSLEGILDPGTPAGKGIFLDVLRAAREKGVPWRVAAAGDSMNLDGVALRVVSPPPAARTSEDGRTAGEAEANDRSLVMELRFGSFAALLTGDAPVTAEDSFVGALLSDRVHLLKVGHHGSATSTSPELLARVSPEAAIISVGRRNRFGHPHPVVLGRLNATGAKVFRTDRYGTLRVRARRDGSYRVIPARSP